MEKSHHKIFTGVWLIADLENGLSIMFQLVPAKIKIEQADEGTWTEQLNMLLLRMYIYMVVCIMLWDTVIGQKAMCVNTT